MVRFELICVEYLSSFGSNWRLEKRYMRPVQARARNWWVQGNGSRAELSLTRHQCSIRCKNSCVCVAYGANKREWELQTTRGTPKRVQKPSINETEFTSRVKDTYGLSHHTVW